MDSTPRAYRLKAGNACSPLFNISRDIPRFAAQDNLVELPGFVRFDAALYYDFTENVTAQLNVENILDEKYFINANSNNNITPGSPTAVKVSLATRF